MQANDLKWLLICCEALLPPAVPVYHDSSGGLVLRQPDSPELWFVVPRDKHQTMVEIIERHRDVLNPWEQKFFTSVKYRRTLSEKQTAVFNGLFEHAVATHCERSQQGYE